MKKPEFLKRVKHVHFVGIKGVGMTALVCCVQDLGIKISGSDTEEFFVTDKTLKQRNIGWKTGFDKKHLSPKPDLVVTTGAHGGLNNPEVLAAKEMDIPVLTQAEALGKMMKGKDGISVCGVGGKTTTSAMIATILEAAGRNPSYAIGVAEIKPLGCPGKYTDSKEFVAEADEYANSPGVDDRPKFSFQTPKVIVTTNVEFDHPDIFRDLEQTKEVFEKFFTCLPGGGLLIIGADSQTNWQMIQKFSGNKQTYGFSPRADWVVEKTYFGQGQTIFNLSYKGVVFEDILIKVPGKFNVLNATAAFAVGNFLGLNPKSIKEGLSRFTGSKRRFEFIGEVSHIKLYDDYAHHPAEIRAVLSAAQQWFPQSRLLVVFQPHTYSRTKALLNDFAQAFFPAKIVAITDIYASAREKDDLGVSGRLLALETSKYHSHVSYQPGEAEVIDFIKREARSGDVILTLGAGNIFLWHKNILKSLKH